jgi:hypothetical protein
MSSLPLFSGQVYCLFMISNNEMKYLISHLKVVVYEKNAHFNVSYNALLTTLEINVVVKLVVLVVIVKSTTTCIKNCKIAIMW